MSLTAAAIRLMAAKGFSAGDIADIAEAMEAPVPALTPGAIRTRKWREKKEAECHGDVTVTGLGDVSREGESTQVEILTSSLRSEDKPPTHPSGASPRKANARPVRRCPDDWAPSEITTARLVNEGFSPGQLERALTMIRDHEFPKARSDWDAAYRNWVRRDSPIAKNPHERPSPDDKFNRRQANHADAFEGARRAAGRDWKP